MKKFVLFFACVFFLAFAVHAQKAPQMKTQKSLHPVQEEDVPEAVIQAFHKDFPDVKVNGWQVLPKDKLKEQDYYLDIADNSYDPSDEPYDYYTVRFFGKNISAIATYNTGGKLIASQEEIKDTALPKAVSQAILSNYPGYKVDKDREMIKNLDQTYYKVKIQKGASHQTVYFNPEGKMVNKKTA